MSNEFKDKVKSHTQRVATGFVHGLEQMASFGSSGADKRFPRVDQTEAIRGDWVRVGNDLREATKKVKQLGKAKG